MQISEKKTKPLHRNLSCIVGTYTNQFAAACVIMHILYNDIGLFT